MQGAGVKDSAWIPASGLLACADASGPAGGIPAKQLESFYDTNKRRGRYPNACLLR